MRIAVAVLAFLFMGPACAGSAASAVLVSASVSPAAAPAPSSPAPPLSTTAATSGWPHLTITGEHTPPTSMLVDGKPAGRQTDKVREMLERLGVPHTIDILPWKRAYMMAQRDPMTCVYSTTRVPAREKQFKWVGPMVETDWVLMGRADRPFRLRTLEDARPLRIGTYNGDARDEYLRSRGFNVDPVPHDASNRDKLLLNRIDLWAVAARPERDMNSEYDLNGRLVPVLVFNRVRLYLACNPTVPDRLVTRMNAAFDTMRRDGTFARIDRRYQAGDAVK